MRWYDPTKRVAQSVLGPHTDEEATDMLGGATDSWAFLREYESHREEGMGVGQAIFFFFFLGHTFTACGTPGTNPWASVGLA